MSNPGSVLIVAAQQSREVDGVIDELRLRDLNVLRFTPCQFPEFSPLSWEPGSARSVFGGPNAAWLFDFSGWSVERSLTGLDREISIAESEAFVEGALLALDTNWLNSPDKIRIASKKILQLKVASDLGIKIPTTLVTNKPEDATTFIIENGDVIAKSLSTGFVTYGGDTLKLYSRRVNLGSSAILEGLRLGPLIFQGLIRKSEEIRTIVVDDSVFAVRADLRGLEDRNVDIRQLDYKAERRRFGSCTDRSDIIEMSRKVISSLNLSYGCMDWAIDGRGTAYFLECNPLGSFKWFEICGGEDITNCIAEALVARCQA